MISTTALSLKETSEYLLGKDNILLLTHKSPDGDTVGSAAALCLALKALGKTTYLFNNRGFTKKYDAYINNLCADEGFEPECICTVDIADIKLFPSNALKYLDKADLAIDHHASHRHYAKHLLIDTSAAACGEIIFDLIKQLNTSVTPEIAEAIYVAISTDTSCFLNSNTTARTHSIAAELLEFPFDFAYVNREFFTVKTKERLNIETRLLSEMRFYLEGKVAVITITNEILKETQANEDDLSNIAAIARSIEGVELGILIREREGDECKVSMRSSELVDVAKLCEKFEGGGHARAAGCAIKSNYAEAEKIIIDMIIDSSIFPKKSNTELTV